jgi:hypothetical protein
MGFCLLNNVAIVAAQLVAEGERVVIIDWDVHHGNGTQSIFWDDPDVLYVSTHQWPAYPGTGAASEIGGSGAVGGPRASGFDNAPNGNREGFAIGRGESAGSHRFYRW